VGIYRSLANGCVCLLRPQKDFFNAGIEQKSGSLRALPYRSGR